MQTKPDFSVAVAELRRCAEDLLRARQTETGQGHTGADTQRLVHELQVHQIELEMQNVELQESWDRMEALLAKYTDLYDFAPVGYLTFDSTGTIREANLAGASLLGIARSALVNRRFGLLVAPADRPAFATFLETAFRSQGREVCELTLQLEGKPPIEVKMEASVLDSGRACRVTLTDLTQHKQAEKDHLILNKLESVGILAGGIAHDFNNLLTVILLNLDLVRVRIPPGEEAPGFLEQAKQAALASRSLTQQLITFAKGDAPARLPTRLAGVIQESARPALSGARARCEFTLAEDLWPAEVDAGQIGQVIRNLVLNAREAMPEGGVVSIRAENVVLSSKDKSSLPPGDYVRVSVTDQGGGIAKEVLPNIFDPYFSTKRRGDQKGMGLGLTICHTIIQKHGGAMDVKSEVGVGTTFHVYLPAYRKPLQEERAPQPKPLPWHGRILVMDDEEGVRKGVDMLLRQMGHKVEAVMDGRTAVEVFKVAQSEGRPFDLVILDLTIRAGMGGREAILELRKLDPAVKAIVMSGYAADPVFREPERYGFQGVLVKPFDRRTLGEVLSRVAEERDRLSVTSD